MRLVKSYVPLAPPFAFFFYHTLKLTPQLLIAAISESRCRFVLLHGGLLKFSDLSQFIDAVTRFLVKISVKMNMYWLYNPTNKGSQFLRASF